MMIRQSMLKAGQQIALNINITKIVPYKFEYQMFFDGCSKGNPGPSGAGAVIYNSDNKEIWSDSSFVGIKATNNQAEYNGLILGLQKALDMNIRSILVKGDSQLVIQQMTGKYKCNSPNIIGLFQTAKILEKKFDHIEYNHVLRHLNKRADELSNQALTNYFCDKYV
jgi:ribonuclease HI/probable phosphoglycerate mutase